MSEDLIKREAVLSTIESMYERCTTDSLADYRALMLEAVKVMPYADRPRGEWSIDSVDEIELSYGGMAYEPVYKCSYCGRVTESYVRFDEPIMPEDADFPNYCGWCGARMKGADDECD